MKYTRTNVYANGGDFTNETLLWYARGVAAMQARKLADPTSWRFWAAIHGIDEPLWKLYGYLSSSDEMPPPGLIDLYWKQCQHGSWYFLPWHRGYLLAYEATVRDAVIQLGGPADWALPYWNYFHPDEFKLPPAFASQNWPGTGINPLFVKQRYGPHNDGNVYVPMTQVNLKALTVPDFTGVASGGDPGFGGVDTGFSHSGQVHGDLETQPHDYVHGLVGGMNPQHPQTLPGVMSDPDTAALDPIFWLHHANIDRLWEVWLQGPVSKGNPTDPNWVNGPASVGQRAFAMPWPPAGTEWNYTPGDMANLASLDYVYDDLSPASVSPQFAERLESVNAAAAAAASTGGAAMEPARQNVEMVGASDQPVRVAGSDPIPAPVRLDDRTRRTMTANLAAAPAEAAEPLAAPAVSPERVFLNLENVRGLLDAAAFHVYVNVPEGADPADHPERQAGSIALFGVRKATVSGEHGGTGLTFVLEITDIVHALHMENALDANALEVRIVPVHHVPEEAQISIGRVSVFRQGQ